MALATVDTIWFGTPGNLVALTHPQGTFEATRALSTAEFALGVGGVRVDRYTGAARRYSIGYDRLTRAAWATLQAYAQGHMGPGGFALLDPGQVNLLTVNQSSATSQLNSASGFTADPVAVPGVLSSSSTVTGPSGTPRSLAWTFSGAATGGTFPTVIFDAASSAWPGIPVRPSTAYTFSVYVKSAVDTAITAGPQIVWLDTAGAQLSFDFADFTVDGTQTRRSVSATSHASAAYAKLRFSATGSTVGAGAVIYVSEPQFERGSSATAWQPGTGVYPVVPVGLPESWTGLFHTLRDSPTFDLVEDVS